jgi:seryl-tRNA synthetase
MIDLKDLRENPDRYRNAVRDKCMDVDVDRLLALDEARRAILTRQETARSEQNKISKEIGPTIGQLKGKLKGAAAGALVQESPCDDLRALRPGDQGKPVDPPPAPREQTL